MQKRRAYRATCVKKICLQRVLEGRQGQAVHVGLDVSKEKIFVMLRWQAADLERQKLGCQLDLAALLTQINWRCRCRFEPGVPCQP